MTNAEIFICVCLIVAAVFGLAGFILWIKNQIDLNKLESDLDRIMGKKH